MERKNIELPPLSLLVSNPQECFTVSDEEIADNKKIPNRTPATVSLKYVLENEVFKNSQAELPVALGITTDGKVKVADIAEMPHLLIAGAAKQGKTNFIKTVIMSLLYSKKPSEVKFVMIEPKMVELNQFSSLPKDRFALADIQDCTEAEYQNPIIMAPSDAKIALLSLCAEMEKRYNLLAEANIRDIKTYNEKNPKQVLPHIVLFIDEYADLIIPGFGINARSTPSKIKESIISLVQKGRAVGLHTVMTTQRVSRDVIDGIVKTHFPARAAFRVATRVDSSTILDHDGAEMLEGKGDMLYSAGVELERIQSPCVTDDEIKRTTDYISKHMESDGCGYYRLQDKPANELENATSANKKDPMFDEIVTFVSKKSQIAAANLQRSFGVGYIRANRIIDQLCEDGVIAPDNGKYRVLHKEKSQKR